MQLVPINKVKPNPDNPRFIRDEKFAQLKKSLQDFPDMLNKRPLICVTENGHYITLGGNMRLRAAQELGYAEMPVILADGWTDEQRREFLIKDNVGFGEWSWDELANNWDEEKLKSWGLDLPMDFNTPEATEDDYEIPDEIITKIKLGDLFELSGNGLTHRILCGDSTSETDVKLLMDGQKADIGLHDPPYGIEMAKGFGGFGGFGKPIARKKYKDEWDNIRPTKELFNFLLTLSKDVLIFGGNFFADLLPQSKHWIVWDKLNTMPTFGDCELIWTNIARKSVKKITCEYNGLIGKEKERFHPTQKPVKLISEIITDYSKQGDLVLDLFLGSGTSLIAGHQLGRNVFGMEISPSYVQCSIDRILKLAPELSVTKNGKPYQINNHTFA